MTSSAQHICTACGLCCDGSLFTKATVQAGDEATVQALGLVVTSNDKQQSSFPLPCRHYCQAQCTVYDQRPPVCRNYRCALLRNVERGALSSSQAQARVAQVRAAQAHLHTLLPAQPSSAINVAAVRKQYAALSRETPEQRRSNAALLMACMHYIALIEMHFVPPGRGNAPEAAKSKSEGV